MNIKSKIESLLFVSGAPFAIQKIVKLLGVKQEEAEKAVLELQKEYKNENRGVQIAVTADKYQIITNPDNSKLIEEFLNQEVIGELTRPQLEALTIIAYRGPISKTELEQIRGVNCSLILRNLMIRGLIEVKTDLGLEKYIITHEFLKFLGITNVNDLPDYEKLNKDKNLEELLNRVEE
ncbi:SMC-Scp complex subunit ScpB [Candidatus Parcubacteria bacterium]|nr:SMC-Scp complex subunit ScpB [Patescibacteria group bacterium]MCG2694133.1 SMC-Scp complex subunit ScpB [Candidatus Parcubacteria bacterium]